MTVVKAENARTDIPLVSIVAVCYNHAKYAEETLDSILNQSYENIELVIIDAFSQDNSADIIQQWIDRNKVHCTFIRQTERRNISQNLNEGLRLISGKYFQGLACDDVLLKNKIREQVSILSASDKKTALVCSNYATIDENSRVLSEKYYQDDYIFPKQTFNAVLEGHNGYGIIIHTPTVLIKTEVFETVGPYNEDFMQEDLYMLLKITNLFQVIYTPKVLVKYRSLSTSLMRSEAIRYPFLLEACMVGNLIYEHVDDASKRKSILNHNRLIIRQLALRKNPDLKLSSRKLFNLSYKEICAACADEDFESRIKLGFAERVYLKISRLRRKLITK